MSRSCVTVAMTKKYTLHPAPGPRSLHIDYRAELNDQQYAAVTAGGPDGAAHSGPMLVIAGAEIGRASCRERV